MTMQGYRDHTQIITPEVEAGSRELVSLPNYTPSAQPPQQVRASADLAAMLPPVPEGRDYDGLMNAARRNGERIGSQWSAQGNNRAIYSFPAGGSRIEGATIWLIGALWQDYGHLLVDSEVTEERADGGVKITTTVIDRINGTIYRRDHRYTLAPAPGKFANKVDQRSRWEAMQLQSAISKAERTTVEHFLPAWYVDAAKDAAYQAMGSKLLTKEVDGRRVTVSLGEALGEAVAAYKALGVSQAQLEARLGAERPLWALTDLSELRVLYRELKSGTVTIPQAFPDEASPAKGSGLSGLASEPQPAPKPAASKSTSKRTSKRASKKTSKAAEPEPAPDLELTSPEDTAPWDAAARLLDAAGWGKSEQATLRARAEKAVAAGQAPDLAAYVEMHLAEIQGADDGMPS